MWIYQQKNKVESNINGVLDSLNLTKQKIRPMKYIGDTGHAHQIFIMDLPTRRDSIILGDSRLMLPSKSDRTGFLTDNTNAVEGQ